VGLYVAQKNHDMVEWGCVVLVFFLTGFFLASFQPPPHRPVGFGRGLFLIKLQHHKLFFFFYHKVGECGAGAFGRRLQ